MAAANELMGELHAVLAAQMVDALKNGVPCKWDDETGDVIATRSANASEWSAIVSFLKANSVTMSVEEDDALKELQQALAKRKSKPVMPDPLDLGGFH